MDPLTHALLGGAAARVALAGPLGRAAWAPAVVGALLPDLDALARLADDPLLHVVLHRHFTHSLALVPIVAALAAAPWLVRPASRGRRRAVLLAAAIGVASHGLLDAATTYGTVLLWPFSDRRFGWSWISVLDPPFTLILAIGVVASLVRRRAAPAAVALGIALAYLAHGAMQRERALEAQGTLAAERGEERIRGDVFPTVGNALVWRSLYRSGDLLRLDRIRVSWFAPATFASTAAVSPLDESGVAEEARRDATALAQFRRFRWFSDGWVAGSLDDPTWVADARYSMEITSFEPVWGIRLRPGTRHGAEWIDRSRERSVDLRALWHEILGLHPAHRPIRPGDVAAVLQMRVCNWLESLG